MSLGVAMEVDALVVSEASVALAFARALLIALALRSIFSLLVGGAASAPRSPPDDVDLDDLDDPDADAADLGAELDAELGAVSALLLPGSTLGGVALFLRLEELAAWASADRRAKARLWDSAEVWRSLASHHNLLLRAKAAGSPQALRSFGGVGLTPVAAAAAARTQFRRAFFRLDGVLLRSLGGGAAGRRSCAVCEEALTEAERMMRGLSLEDRAAAADPSTKTAAAAAAWRRSEGERLEEEEEEEEEDVGGVDIAFLMDCSEHALNELDPSRVSAMEAAERLVEAARRALPVLGERGVERLEHALWGAQHLHELMMSSMQEHLGSQLRILEDNFFEEGSISWEAANSCRADDDLGESAGDC